MSEPAPAPGRTFEVVGRESERGRIDGFVSGIPRGARALLVCGEPGIGKTALWRLGIERCRGAGFRVLVARPAEEEMSLALVGLVDLFDGLGVDEGPLRSADPFLRGRSALEQLRALAEERPVVLAIDDLQWLDAASARALRYAIRRLDAEPVGVLGTVRDRSREPLRLDSLLPSGRAEALDLGPLDLRALRAVLTGIVASISRPALRRIHETSGGNPLYAIELARGLSAAERAGRSGVLPMPDTLQSAIARSLATTPRELQPVLETLAALGPASMGDLVRAVPDADVGGLVETAARSGLLVVEGGDRVRFAHPLVGSGVYARMSSLARRSLHARLATRASDEDVRARHLALSTDEPDASVARLLEAAAERAGARGAFDLAAEFTAHSLRLTPPGDVDDTRRLALAEIERLAASGELGRALTLADDLIALLPRGPGRAQALLQRAELEDDDLATGEALMREALEDVGDDDVLRARVLDMLGWSRGMFVGDLSGGLELARAARDLAERRGDVELLMMTAFTVPHMEALSGSPRPEQMALAVALEDELGRPLLWSSARSMQGDQLLWAGDLPSARSLYRSVHRASEGSGFEVWRPYTLYDLALGACAAGEFGEADDMVRQGIEAARDAEDTWGERLLLYPLALAEAWLGRVDAARAACARRRAEAEARGERPGIARALGVMGLVELAEGNPAGAAYHLTGAADLLEEMGYANPAAFPVLPDAVEALALAGRLEESGALLDRLARQASRLASEWVEGLEARARGTFLLAAGPPARAVELLEPTVDRFDRLGFAPDAARAALTLGRAQLRSGLRGAAADTLEDAGRRFERMRAPVWAMRASEEAARARAAPTASPLTATERRIARLVADGLRNQEVAETLIVSAATIEAHLTRMYRKLDIRSRSDLARLVADGTLDVDVRAVGDPA